jgi:hypothetical protein
MLEFYTLYRNEKEEATKVALLILFPVLTAED